MGQGWSQSVGRNTLRSPLHHSWAYRRISQVQSKSLSKLADRGGLSVWDQSLIMRIVSLRFRILEA